MLVSGWQPVGAAGSARPQLAQNSGDNFATTDSPALPPQVSPEKCRCAVGSILSEGVESPSPELVQLYQKFGFKVFSFPAPSHVVTATFPYTSALSIWLATRRVHPALDAYIKVRHRPGGTLGVGSQNLGPEPGRTAGLGRAAPWGPVEQGRWAESAGIASRCPDLVDTGVGLVQKPGLVMSALARGHP